MGYSTEDLVKLEARIYAIERYIREHDPDGDWFLEQEFYKYSTVAASRHGDSDIMNRMIQNKEQFEDRCRKQGIEIKQP